MLVKLSSKEEEKNTKLSPKQIVRIEIIIIIARVKKIHNIPNKQSWSFPITKNKKILEADISLILMKKYYIKIILKYTNHCLKSRDLDLKQ